MQTRTVYTPSGKAIRNVPLDVTDEEVFQKYNNKQMQQASLKEKEQEQVEIAPEEKELQNAIAQQVGEEPSVSTDLQRVVLGWGEGISNLVADTVVNPIAENVFGVEGGIDTDYYVSEIMKSMASATLPGKQEDLFTPEGEVKDTETVTGMAAEIGTVVAGGAALSAVKGIKALPSIIRYGLGGAAAEQIMYGRDENIAQTVLDETDWVSESSMTRDVLEFLATDEEDENLENRLKVSIEGFLLGGTLSTLVGGTQQAVKQSKKLFNKIPSNLTKNEQVEVAVDYLKDARAKAEYKHKVPLVFSETPETIAQVEQQASSKLNRFMRQMFTSRGYWTTPAFNAFEDSQYAQRQLVSEAENISNRLQKSLRSLGDEVQTEEMTKKVQASLGDNLDFHKNVSPSSKIEYVQEQYGFTPEVAEEVINARTLIDNMSKTLANSSIPDNEFKQTILDNSGEYIRRSYRLFEDSGYKPSAQVKDDAIDFYAQQISTSNKNLSVDEAYEKARGKVDEILDKDNVASDAAEYYEKVRRVNTEILKEKKDIPEPIRKLMGEIEEPAENVVLTVSKLAKLTERNKFFESLHTMGRNKYVFDDPIERNGVAYVTPVTGTNSVLDGKYVTKEIFTAIKEEESTILNGKDTGLVKMLRNFATLKGKSQAAKTIYSHVTHLRNILGGAQFGLANGVNPFTSGGQSFKAIYNQISQGGDKGLDEAYQKYLRLGIINTDVKVNEFRALLETGYESTADKFLDKLSAKASKYGLSEKIQALPGDVYMAVDDFYKMNNFERELDTLKKAFPESSVETLEEEAAMIVQATLPNYDRVPKGIKTLRYLPIGNFVAFPTEMWRTSANILKQGAREITSGNKELGIRGAQRLAGFTTAMTGVGALAAQSAKIAGLTPEEQEAVQTMSNTPWSKSPRIIHRGEDGKLFTADTQFIDSYSPIKTPFNEAMYQIEQGQLRGADLDTVLGDAILAGTKSLLAPYIGESMLTEAFTDVYSAWQSPDGRTNSGKLLLDPTEDKTDQAIMLSTHLLSAFVPGSVDSLVGLADAAFEKPNKNTGKPKDYNAELATNLTGVRFTEFSPEVSLMYGIKNYNFEKRNVPFAKADFKKTGDDVYDQFVGRQKKLYENQQELYMKMLASEQLIGRSRTIEIMHMNGMSKKEMKSLISGYFQGEKPNMSLIADIYKQTPGIDNSQKEELTRKLISVYSELSQTRLYPANEEEGFVPPEPFRLQKAKGGRVNVPQAPLEPDERIDKMTGRPYNEQAGTAFIDVEDRAMFKDGGKVSFVDRALDKILQNEGGYQDSKTDRGNIVKDDGTVIGTNKGITPQAYANFKGIDVSKVSADDMKQLTEDTAREIYKKDYYFQPGVDKIEDDKLRENVFDMVVNSGQGNAIKVLQGLAGVTPDGVLGPKTLESIKSKNITTNDYVDARKSFYSNTVTAKPEQATYLQGWNNRAEKYRTAPSQQVTMEQGDTIYGIAKENNMTVEQLFKLNGITDPTILSVGTELKLK
jgi:lysozyme family protein